MSPAGREGEWETGAAARTEPGPKDPEAVRAAALGAPTPSVLVSHKRYRRFRLCGLSRWGNKPPPEFLSRREGRKKGAVGG